MNLSKVFNYVDNFAFKLSKRVFKGIFWLSNILNHKRNLRANAFYQRATGDYSRGWKCPCYLEELSEFPEFIFGDNK